MGRIRSVKPQTFTDEQLWDAEQESKLPVIRSYIGLWTQCDREGRFEWRPRMLKIAILPYDTAVDFADVLNVLARGRWVVPYEQDGQMYGYIRTWHKHQFVNHRESPSFLPAPTAFTVAAAHRQLDLPLDASATLDSAVPDACATRESPDDDATQARTGGREGKGREGEGNRHATLTRPVQPVATLPLNDKSEFPISAEQVQHWAGLYRAVDVENELRLMRGWLEGNPTKRKTRTGILRFITTWLAKEQDRGHARNGGNGNGGAAPPRGNSRDATDIIEQRRKAREQNAHA